MTAQLIQYLMMVACLQLQCQVQTINLAAFYEFLVIFVEPSSDILTILVSRQILQDHDKIE